MYLYSCIAIAFQFMPPHWRLTDRGKIIVPFAKVAEAYRDWLFLEIYQIKKDININAQVGVLLPYIAKKIGANATDIIAGGGQAQEGQFTLLVSSNYTNREADIREIMNKYTPSGVVYTITFF